MKIKKATLRSASLLARAYAYAMQGNAEEAGELMVEAVQDGNLDAIMHGIATSMGMSDEAEYEDMEASDAEDIEVDEDVTEDDEVVDEEDVEDEEVDEEDVEDEEEVADEEEEDEEVEMTSSCRIPQSCARLASLRF